MQGYEPSWDFDLQLGVEPRGPYSVNDYADFVDQHLRVSAQRMQNWYDRKVYVQHFDVGVQVYFLNLKHVPR